MSVKKVLESLSSSLLLKKNVFSFFTVCKNRGCFYKYFFLLVEFWNAASKHMKHQILRLLEKSSSKTVEMLKKAYRNEAIKNRQCTSGTSVFVNVSQALQIQGESKLEVFFDYQDVTHRKFIPQAQTVNKELYPSSSTRCSWAKISWQMNRKWLGFAAWQRPGILLHNSEKLPCQELCHHSETPPYFRDLPIADFYLFPQLKMKLKRQGFADSAEVMDNVMMQLKQKNSFLDCFFFCTNGGTSI